MFRLIRDTAAALGVSLVLLAGTAAAHEPLKVGIDAAYRPFAYVEPNGELAGFEIDLVKAVCEKMQRKCEISNVPWEGIFAALESGNIDMIGTTVTKSPARLEKYDASATIYGLGFGFIVPADTDTSKGLDGLRGKPVGTITGTEAFYAFIKGMLGDDADIRGYQNPDAGILDLDSGRIAAFAGDNLQLGAQFVKDGKYKWVVEPNFDSKWTGDGRGFIFRKGSGDLTKPVDAALAALAADGTIDRLAIPYFGTAFKAK